VTPDAAKADASKRVEREGSSPYDNRPRELHPCSLELYAFLLFAEEMYGTIEGVIFRIDRGVAVPKYSSATVFTDAPPTPNGVAEPARSLVGMYVDVADREQVQGFGVTPEHAVVDATRRYHKSGTMICDGPISELFPCSPELYRLLEAEPRERSHLLRCRIVRGVAVPARKAKSRPNPARKRRRKHIRARKRNSSRTGSGTRKKRIR